MPGTSRERDGRVEDGHAVPDENPHDAGGHVDAERDGHRFRCVVFLGTDLVKEEPSSAGGDEHDSVVSGHRICQPIPDLRRHTHSPQSV